MENIEFLDEFEEKVEEVLRNESFISDNIAEWEEDNLFFKPFVFILHLFIKFLFFVHFTTF